MQINNILIIMLKHHLEMSNCDMTPEINIG